LHFAAWYSHIDIVQQLLLAGAACNEADVDGCTALTRAAERGNLELIEVLLDAGADAMLRSKEGSTTLHYASKQPDVKVAERFFKAGVNPCDVDHDQWRPLHIALLKGHRDMAAYLFSRDGSSEKAHDFTVSTNLSILDMAKALTQMDPYFSVSWGCLVTGYFDEGIFSRAVEAAEKRIELDPLNSELPYDPERLKHGNNCDNCKETVVGFHHRCTGCPQFSLCNKCFTSTPHPHPQHQFITTPSVGWVTQRTRQKLVTDLQTEWTSALLSASRNGQIKVVQEILKGEERSDIDLVDDNGYTSLHIAAASGHTEVVRILLENDANVNAKSKDEMTPVLAAALQGRIETFNVLRSIANLKAVNIFGQDALYLAAEGGHIQIVEALLEGGGFDERKTKWGWTALDVASYHGHVEIVELLLTSLHFGIPTVTSAFQIACQRAHVKIMRALLSAGADPAVPEEGGQIPLQEAWKRGDSAVWEELILAHSKTPGGQEKLDTAVLYEEIVAKLKLGGRQPLADSLLKRSLAIYRNEICKLFPSIKMPDTLGSVPTDSVLLEELVARYKNSLHMDKPSPSSRSNNGVEVSLMLEVLWNAPTSIKDPSIWNCVANEYCLTLESDAIREAMCMDVIEKYVQKTWGPIGTTILEEFLRAARVVLSDPDYLYVKRINLLEDEGNDKKEEAPTMVMVATRHALRIGGSLWKEHWTSLGECILWLEQVIGSPKSGLATRTWAPSLRTEPHPNVPEYQVTIDPLREDAFNSLAMRKMPCLSLQLVEEHPLHVEPSENCWTALIKSAYVARRSIQSVEQLGKGIRVPFDTLISITAASKFVLYGSHPAFAGMRTALVPVKELSTASGSIQWHLILEKDAGIENSVLEDRVTEFLQESAAPPITASTLNKVKASTDMYLGWTNQVKVTLGTKEFRTATIPRSTDLPTATERWRLPPISVNVTPGLHATFGSIVALVGALTVGTTLERKSQTSLQTEPPSLASNFSEAVRQLYGWTTVIYDVGEDQAWLVPMLNVVVYMTQIRRALYGRTTFEIGFPIDRDLDLVQRRLKRIAALQIYEETSKDGESTDESRQPLTFASSLFDCGKQLLKRMNDTKALCEKDVRIGVELSDLIEEKRNWNPKRVEFKTRSGRCWNHLVSRQEPILVCKGIDRPIQSTAELTESTDQQGRLQDGSRNYESHLVRSAPKGSLFCMVELLKRRMTGELEYSAEWEGHDKTGYISCPRNSWRWWLRGDPFGTQNREACSQDGMCSNCWFNKAQKIEEGTKRKDHVEEMFTLQSAEDLMKGLCFGTVEDHESWKNQMSVTVNDIASGIGSIFRRDESLRREDQDVPLRDLMRPEQAEGVIEQPRVQTPPRSVLRRLPVHRKSTKEDEVTPDIVRQESIPVVSVPLIHQRSVDNQSQTTPTSGVAETRVFTDEPEFMVLSPSDHEITFKALQAIQT
jgi:ankyrin repeat protein